MKSKRDDLDVDELKTVLVYLKKLSDLVDNDVARRLYMLNLLKKLMPLILVNLLKKQIMMQINTKSITKYY